MASPFAFGLLCSALGEELSSCSVPVGRTFVRYGSKVGVISFIQKSDSIKKSSTKGDIGVAVDQNMSVLV